MQTGNTDLTLAVLIYATASLERGDWAVLRDMNFGEQEAKALRSLQFAEFLSVANNMDGHVLNVDLDRERFWIVMEQMKREHEIDQLKNELVYREAPVDMMRQLFGTTDHQYSMLCRRLRRKRRVGRPPDPDSATMDTIWQAWQKHLDGREPESAQEWLTLADASGVDCRTLWRFIRGVNALQQTS